MTTFGLDDLRKIMEQVSDEDDELNLDGDIAEQPFDELGLDSLGVLDLMTRIQQDWHVAVPDEVISTARVPQDVVDFVSQRLREQAGAAAS